MMRNRIESVDYVVTKTKRKKYKTRHKWMGKVIHWESRKKLKIYQAHKKLKFYEAHKFLWNFEIQTDHLIPARRPDHVIISRKEKRSLAFAVPAGHQAKIKENKKETNA